MLNHTYNEGHHNNPLDFVEDLMIANDWSYKRHTSEELLLSIAGRAMNYDVSFQWDEAQFCLRISCHVDLEIPLEKLGEAILITNQINQTTKAGFFVVDPDTGCLLYKYNLLSSPEVDAIDSTCLTQTVETVLCDCEDNVAVLNCFLNKDICKDDKKLIALLIVPAEGHA